MEAKEKTGTVIAQCPHVYFNDGGQQRCKGCGFSRSYILGYEAGLAADKWVRILSEDGLPRDGRYLVTLVNRDGRRKVTVLNWNNIWTGQKAIAYRPLPEPYKDETADGGK